MKISGAGLLSLLSSSTATQSLESESNKTELSPLKQRLTALVWHMASEMAGETNGFISQWALRQIIEGKILPKLYQLSDEELRVMLGRARDFMGELLGADKTELVNYESADGETVMTMVR